MNVSELAGVRFTVHNDYAIRENGEQWSVCDETDTLVTVAFDANRDLHLHVTLNATGGSFSARIPDVAVLDLVSAPVQRTITLRGQLFAEFVPDRFEPVMFTDNTAPAVRQQVGGLIRLAVYERKRHTVYLTFTEGQWALLLRGIAELAK